MASVHKKLFLVLLVVLTLATMLFATQSQPVEAGTNGQQLRFVCSLMHEAIIRGYNQNGQRVEWRGSANQGTITTWGWWWKGWVRVYYWNRSRNYWYSQPVYVPKFQVGDTYEARC
ncbi:MAG: hypothetical protein UV59_C0010G0005 [Candidatus Gottesmanbacteria bacterium GW2011_GWA1_43_11]|uniref:Ig-like domain-containing protein n=1 Tax=Candidatus Gottesmanbacteria bacterium GW2011_GWA1_43_11 TaxID=1618436 RepID=A0A0G1CI49_9BACT|nr:MAG: hypothetical protein UV59_C0010G0005 [Candidatus Gottesmanbacteria bacterium GW2011_GWA1_43_11]